MLYAIAVKLRTQAPTTDIKLAQLALVVQGWIKFTRISPKGSMGKCECTGDAMRGSPRRRRRLRAGSSRCARRSRGTAARAAGASATRISRSAPWLGARRRTRPTSRRAKGRGGESARHQASEGKRRRERTTSRGVLRHCAVATHAPLRSAPLLGAEEASAR